MPNDPKNLIEVLIALLTLITSLEIAQLLGPYAAIVTASGAGAFLSLASTSKEMPRWWNPWVYVVIRVILAIVITVPLARLLGGVASWLVPNITLIPIALGLGLISDYETVRQWLLKRVQRKIEEKVGDDAR